MRNRDLRPAAKANPTIQQAFERFQKYNRLKNLSQGSLDFYAAKGRRFFRFLGDTEQPITTVTEETVEDYIFYMKDQQLHDTTINTNLRMVRAFLYWCMEKGYLEKYVTLNELTKCRPIIFMSATAHPFFHRWRYETNEVLPENYYHIPSDYSYVERAVFYWTDAEETRIIRQEARRGKVLVFVDRMASIRKLVKELENKFAGEIATACSPYRPEAREFDGLEEVLQDGKLRKQITIVTTVFYNGVNIKDPELTCIISKLWDPIVNAQILGRKRPVSKQDTCTVYFKGYSHDRIKQEREHIRKRQLEPAKNWKDGKSAPEVWQTYLHKPGIVKMLDKYSRTVNRDEYGNGWEWRRRAEHQYLVQMDALKLMMEKGYQWGMLYAVAESDALLSKIEPLRFKELEDYIEEHLEEKIPWEIMRKELVERGCITNPKDRHKNKNMPELRAINSRLKDYNAFVESVQKWIGTNERARFWILHRLHT